MVKRILLVEDDPASQDIIASLLASRGHRVDVVTSSIGALEHARNVAYDVMLLDLKLPEVARLLREQKSKEGPVPVLIGLSRDKSAVAAQSGSDAVFEAVLLLPAQPPLLFAAVERAGGEPRRAAMQFPGPDRRVPDVDGTRNATGLIWRNHGLASHPRAYVCPPPSLEQVEALSLCFDLVVAGNAQLVILLERHGIGEAKKVSRRTAGTRLPIIGVSSDHEDVCDAIFNVGDTPSWRAVATLLGGKPVDAISAPFTPHEMTGSDQARSVPPVAVPEPPDHTDLRAMIQRSVSAPLVTLLSRLERSLQNAADIHDETTIIEGAAEVLGEIARAAGSLTGSVKAAKPAPEAPQEKRDIPAQGDVRAAVRQPPRNTGLPLMTEAVTRVMGATAPGSAARILLINDSMIESQVLMLILTEAGHHVCRISGVEAAGFAKPSADGDIAVIIDGPSSQEPPIVSARFFRNAHPGVPMIVLSAKMSDADRAGFHALGRTTLLSKPFTPEALSRAIAGCYRGSSTSEVTDLEIVDVAARETLNDIIGEPSVNRLTLQLLNEIETIASDTQIKMDRSGAARLADLSERAAMFGFRELAVACEGFASAFLSPLELVEACVSAGAKAQRVRDVLGA